MHGAQPVAIKVMNPAWLRARPDTFWREAVVLQQCRHPCIVQLLGLYTGDAVRGRELQHAEQPEDQLPIYDDDTEEPTEEQLLDLDLDGQLEERPRGVMVVTELMPGGALFDRLAEPAMRWYRRCGLQRWGFAVGQPRHGLHPALLPSLPWALTF